MDPRYDSNSRNRRGITSRDRTVVLEPREYTVGKRLHPYSTTIEGRFPPGVPGYTGIL